MTRFRATPILGEASTKLNRDIVRLSAKGWTIRAMADELGVRPCVIGNRMAPLRAKGLIEPARKRKVASSSGRAVRNAYAKASATRVGSMADFFEALTYDEVEWLKRVIPNGLTVSEFLAALVRDAIAEDEL